MPFIKIKSLPFQEEIDFNNIINSIGNDFSKSTTIDIKHITVTWQFVNNYSVGGKTFDYQTEIAPPLLVDILVPDFNTQEQIETMLNTAAESIANHTEINIKNIFINLSKASPGSVFDDGEIIKW